MRNITSALALLSVVPISSLSAQAAASVEPGQRVRVTVPTAGPIALVGKLDSVDADSLRLRRGEEPPMAISILDVVRLEVSRGHRRALGTGLGFAAGAVIGATAGAMSYSGTDTPKETVALASAAFGGVVGAVLGLLVGGMSERWEEVPLDRLRVNVASRHDGGLAVGLWLAL